MIKFLFAVPPKVGSRWTYDSDKGNPFCRFFVTVLAVKGRWVLYKLPYEAERSTSIRAFRVNYREIKHDVQETPKV